jgi:hypothetical protein
MPRWVHTINLKDLWAEPAEDDDAQAIKVAPQVAERIRALAKRIEPKDPLLSSDLEDVADEFADVPDCDHPQRAFNHTLDGLYDIADANRIWVA